MLQLSIPAVATALGMIQQRKGELVIQALEPTTGRRSRMSATFAAYGTTCAVAAIRNSP